MFWTAVHGSFWRLVTRIYKWLELSRVQRYRNADLKGNHTRHRDYNELHFHALSRYYMNSF